METNGNGGTTAVRATHYRVGGTTDWVTVPEGATVEALAERLLKGFSGQDSDGHYSEFVEVAYADGSRRYGVAEFEPCGTMTGFRYGDEAEVKRAFGDWCVDRCPHGPGRDWLLLR